MDQTRYRNELLSELASLRTVDCHSHTLLRRDYYAAGGLDLFSLTSYFDRDIASTAGAIYKDTTSDTQRWERLRPVLAKARNVSYWRHNLVVYRELFGLGEAELTDANWQSVNQAIRERSRDPAWYDHVTRDVCGLRTQVRNIPWFEDWEPEYFTAVLRMESALCLHQAETRQRLEAETNVAICGLATAKQALELLVDRYTRRGSVGLKLAHAYTRTLESVPVTVERATALFDRALVTRSLPAGELKDIQDHFIFFLAELCRARNLVFQIHTGVQGNWGHIPDSDPLLLIPLLKAFPEVRFDLFHTGYPYARELGMLGKHYPNVWLNLAWAYIISIAASRQILAEWLDLVPGYRILGFGSDVRFPEMIYGHLLMARSCLADVLTDKVTRDFLSEEEGASLARRLFRDNALELYGLSPGGGTGAPGPA